MAAQPLDGAGATVERRRVHAARPVSSASRRRVLLAVHDAPLRASLAAALERAGWAVVPADDGLAGWCTFEVECPEVVVLDLDMPCISGFRLLRLLRTSAKPVARIVVVNAFAVQPPRATDSRGQEVYLRKPFPPSRLVQHLHLLSHHSGPSQHRGRWGCDCWGFCGCTSVWGWARAPGCAPG